MRLFCLLQITYPLLLLWNQLRYTKLIFMHRENTRELSTFPPSWHPPCNIMQPILNRMEMNLRLHKCPIPSPLRFLPYPTKRTVTVPFSYYKNSLSPKKLTYTVHYTNSPIDPMSTAAQTLSSLLTKQTTLSLFNACMRNKQR